jgi:hypothetical protein
MGKQETREKKLLIGKAQATRLVHMKPQKLEIVSRTSVN